MATNKKFKRYFRDQEFAWRFSKNNTDPDARYGLPKNVEFCRSCVISNQRPSSTIEFTHTVEDEKDTISFDKTGICDACRIADQKKHQIDWEERENELQQLCNQHRSSGGEYDCLVPGSGGKDSFYAAHTLKYKYGMSPLTVTWAPHRYTDWGWNNFQAWLDAGFDNYLVTPNPRVHRLITRLAVEKLFHPFQPFIIGQKSLAPKMASLFRIPLVFYGENEAEYGNPLSDIGVATRDESFFSSENYENLFLGGVSVAELYDSFGLTRIDLDPYMPVDKGKLEKNNVAVHYLGYYLKWHPQGAYYYAVENGGFRPSPERTPGTYSKYNSIDDKIDDFHYYTTFIKFGIGRATYDASQEIRNDEITREEGIALVKKFDGEYPERFSDEILNYLSLPESEYPIASANLESPIIDRDYFFDLADSFRSPHLWVLKKNNWYLRKVIRSE
jgi:N-acetyl sugar amidotransferase